MNREKAKKLADILTAYANGADLQYEARNEWTDMKDGYTLGNDIQSKVMAFAFGLSAEIERDMISRRTKEALELRRAQGIHIGRQFGSKNSYTKITGKENWIKEQLNKGVPKTEIAKALKIDRSTLWRYIREGRV